IAAADGQVANANLSDYEIPAFADLPVELTQDLIEHGGAEIHGLGGRAVPPRRAPIGEERAEIRGLGEAALPPVPAAIGTALASLGVHVTELPMTAETVLEAVDARAAVAEGSAAR